MAHRFCTINTSDSDEKCEESNRQPPSRGSAIGFNGFCRRKGSTLTKILTLLAIIGMLK